MKQPLEWQGNKLRMLDQTKLPGVEVWLELHTYLEVAHAIKTMRVRGAPAIGVAAGYGVALGALGIKSSDPDEFKTGLEQVYDTLASTRPTARNLFAAIDSMRKSIAGMNDVEQAKQALVSEAVTLHSLQMEADRAISTVGSSLIHPGSTILTHCNTGPLATAGRGTALGIIISAFQQNRVKMVYNTETRPLFQGARLTAWELKQAGVPFKLITDSMAGYVMNKGLVDAVIVGADRIAANGDTANKIGTYTLAVLATENHIPFYVAAPTSTIDTSINTGADIVIEERSPDEVTCVGGVRMAPEGTQVLNPAFDVTPAKYITAIITEEGLWEPGTYGET